MIPLPLMISCLLSSNFSSIFWIAIPPYVAFTVTFPFNLDAKVAAIGSLCVVVGADKSTRVEPRSRVIRELGRAAVPWVVACARDDAREDARESGERLTYRVAQAATLVRVAPERTRPTLEDARQSWRNDAQAAKGVVRQCLLAGVGCLAGLLAGCLAGCFVEFLAIFQKSRKQNANAGLVGWLTLWRAGWLAGWLVGWLAGWRAG